MLLIQHEEAQRTQGKKHSGSGPHNHHGIAALETAAPGTNPFTGRATAVIFENALSETPTTTIHKLGDQADLWSEQQNMTANPQLRSCQLQINLGFTGAGDAPEQQFAPLRECLKTSDHRLLLICQQSRRLQLDCTEHRPI